MEISDLLTPSAVIAKLHATSKKQALQELAKRAAELVGEHERVVFDVLLERERLGTTGVGGGVAIPHGKLPGVPNLLAAFGRSKKGVDFAAIDGKPTYLFFVLFAPENSAGIHLKALARISRLFKSPPFRQSIMAAQSASEIAASITGEDSKY